MLITHIRRTFQSPIQQANLNTAMIKLSRSQRTNHILWFIKIPQKQCVLRYFIFIPWSLVNVRRTVRSLLLCGYLFTVILNLLFS